MQWEFFTVKRNIVLEVSKELLTHNFAEFHRSSGIKNITARLNIDAELQLDDRYIIKITAIYTNQVQSNIYQSGKSSFK